MEESDATCPIVRIDRVRDEDFSAYTPVLQQPESKYPDLLTLDELHRPVNKVVIDVPVYEHRQLIPIFVECGEAASVFVEINLAASADARILFVEVPDQIEGRYEAAIPTDRERQHPAIYCSMKLAANARLEAAVVHDFRRFDPESGELRPAVPGEVRVSPRPATELETRPVYLYHATVQRDARMDWLSVNLDESIHEYGMIRLVDSGAEALWQTAAYVPEGQVQHYQINIEHEAPYTFSQVKNHGVTAAHSEGRFVARGRIHKGANGTNCDQTSRFITLDASSRTFTDPLLVIDEFDVKASHAGSSGQLDEAQIYYLQSRGIDRKAAQILITQGFLNPLIDSLALDRARQLTHDILQNTDGGEQA